MPLLQQTTMYPLFVVAIYIIATNFMLLYDMSTTNNDSLHFSSSTTNNESLHFPSISPNNDSMLYLLLPPANEHGNCDSSY